MAKSINFRFFNDGNRDVQFSSICFRSELNEWKERQRRADSTKKATIEDGYVLISETANVSVDAVRNWYKGSNGPSDLQTVKKIASALEIDYTELIVASNSESKSIEQDFTPTSNSEKELLMQIYKLFIDYVYWFVGNRTQSYASLTLEHPEAERQQYIWNLYHYLDQIALSITEETYKKLRKTIAELEYMVTGGGPYILTVPPLWYDLNPYLTYFYFDFGGFEDMEELFEDVSDEENYEILHTYTEDLPFLLDAYKEYCKKNNNPLPENYIVEALMIDRAYDFPAPYQLYTREVANTIKILMKHMFPKYFDTVNE